MGWKNHPLCPTVALKLHAENCGVLKQALMSVRSFSINGVVAKQRFGRFKLPLWCLGGGGGIFAIHLLVLLFFG